MAPTLADYEIVLWQGRGPSTCPIAICSLAPSDLPAGVHSGVPGWVSVGV